MIRPIVAYGASVLKKKAEIVQADTPDLTQLIEDMWETMYASHGVGLAAPQIGRSLRLFVIDAEPFASDEDLEPEEAEVLKTFKKVFINPTIILEEGPLWGFTEGCLSIPDIREEVLRKTTVHIEYYNEKFQLHKAEYSGLAARVVQHEYDHIEGILFTDHLSPLKRRLLKNKLTNISKGTLSVDYPMKFPLKSKRS